MKVLLLITAFNLGVLLVGLFGGGESMLYLAGLSVAFSPATLCILKSNANLWSGLVAISILPMLSIFFRNEELWWHFAVVVVTYCVVGIQTSMAVSSLYQSVRKRLVKST